MGDIGEEIQSNFIPLKNAGSGDNDNNGRTMSDEEKLRSAIDAFTGEMTSNGMMNTSALMSTVFFLMLLIMDAPDVRGWGFWISVVLGVISFIVSFVIGFLLLLRRMKSFQAPTMNADSVKRKVRLQKVGTYLGYVLMVLHLLLMLLVPMHAAGMDSSRDMESVTMETDVPRVT